MESLTGRGAPELQDELGPLAYRNPEGGAWETADRYLSGNVRAKLSVAQASEQIDPAYRRNVEALEAVQPKDLEPGEIEARLGSSWIPPQTSGLHYRVIGCAPRGRENRTPRPLPHGRLNSTMAQSLS